MSVCFHLAKDKKKIFHPEAASWIFGNQEKKNSVINHGRFEETFYSTKKFSFSSWFKQHCREKLSIAMKAISARQQDIGLFILDVSNGLTVSP